MSSKIILSVKKIVTHSGCHSNGWFNVRIRVKDDKVLLDLNEQPLVIVEGYDKINQSSFGHAVVMTKYVLLGTTFGFELKNSLDGAHLKGYVSFSQISSNQEIRLTKIKNQNPNYDWTMNCYLTLFVNF